MGGVAQAHYVYGQAFTYYSQDSCESTRSEISHGGGGGYVKIDGATLRSDRFTGTSCIIPFDLAQGAKALRYDLWKWNGSQWTVCAGSNYVYNTSVASKWVIYYDFGSAAYCGPGTYGTYGYTFHYNGAWYGGGIWSGNHNLPA